MIVTRATKNPNQFMFIFEKDMRTELRDHVDEICLVDDEIGIFRGITDNGWDYSMVYEWRGKYSKHSPISLNIALKGILPDEVYSYLVNGHNKNYLTKAK